MYERWQIYQKTFPTIPVGGVVGVPFTLDSDAPFALRMVRTRGIGLNGWRFQNARKAYQSNFLRTDWEIPMDPAGAPFPSHGVPVYPQEIYPANGQIIIDVGNATGEPIENARMLFYGSKLFDRPVSPDYPATIAPFPFIYPLTNSNGLNNGPVTIDTAASAAVPTILRDLQLRIGQDADFVLRQLVADPFALNIEGGPVPLSNLAEPLGNTYEELYVIVKDEARKAYMNEPIHINDVFGQGAPNPMGANTSVNGVGPVFAGLLTPELIIERQHSLYVDLYRFDVVGFPVDMWLRFHGAKLFRGTK